MPGGCLYQLSLVALSGSTCRVSGVVDAVTWANAFIA